MTRKSTLASLVVAVVLSLGLTACKDTKTLQENEQLKAQVADLQKQNGEMGNNLETVTAARDALTKENDSLKAQIKAMKPKSAQKESCEPKAPPELGLEDSGDFETRRGFGMREPVSIFNFRKGRQGS